MYKANGKTFANIGEALRAGYWGEFGSSRSVTLKREGYFDTVIAKGGPSATGWYVKEMGDKKPQPRKTEKPKKVTVKYLVVGGRCVKL